MGASIHSIRVGTKGAVLGAEKRCSSLVVFPLGAQVMDEPMNAGVPSADACGPATIVMFVTACAAVLMLTGLYGYIALALGAIAMSAGATFGLALMWWARPWEPDNG